MKKKIKIALIMVNYNNSDITIKSIESIKNAECFEDFRCVIVDNNSKKNEIIKLKEKICNEQNIFLIKNLYNVGYFKALNIGLENIYNNYNPTYIIIGNNDLLFPKDLWNQINKNSSLFEMYPVVCPDLIDLDGVHQNPHVIRGVSKFREMIYDLYFISYIIARLIKLISNVTKKITKRKDMNEYTISREISQGYGACYILGKIFIEKIKYLWCPVFLMGEEYFLGLQLRKNGYNYYYESTIQITHLEHSTFSKLPERKLWFISKQSHKIYRKYIKRPLYREVDLEKVNLED